MVFLGDHFFLVNGEPFQRGPPSTRSKMKYTTRAQIIPLYLFILCIHIPLHLLTSPYLHVTRCRNQTDLSGLWGEPVLQGPEFTKYCMCANSEEWQEKLSFQSLTGKVCFVVYFPSNDHSSKCDLPYFNFQGKFLLMTNNRIYRY